jgi:hypothetical protein
MPYKLRKAPKRDLYWVVGEDGKKHSEEPLPRARAEAQMRALYSAMRKNGEVSGGMEHNAGAQDARYDSTMERARRAAERLRESMGLPNFTEMVREQKRDFMTELDIVRDNNGGESARNTNVRNRIKELFDNLEGEHTRYATRRGFSGSGRRKRGGVSVSKKQFVKEHTKLINVLRKGKRSQLNAEASEQSKELKKVRGGRAERQRPNQPPHLQATQPPFMPQAMPLPPPPQISINDYSQLITPQPPITTQPPTTTQSNGSGRRKRGGAMTKEEFALRRQRALLSIRTSQELNNIRGISPADRYDWWALHPEADVSVLPKRMRDRVIKMREDFALGIRAPPQVPYGPQSMDTLGEVFGVIPAPAPKQYRYYKVRSTKRWSSNPSEHFRDYLTDWVDSTLDNTFGPNVYREERPRPVYEPVVASGRPRGGFNPDYFRSVSETLLDKIRNGMRLDGVKQYLENNLGFDPAKIDGILIEKLPEVYNALRPDETELALTREIASRLGQARRGDNMSRMREAVEREDRQRELDTEKQFGSGRYRMMPRGNRKYDIVDESDNVIKSHSSKSKAINHLNELLDESHVKIDGGPARREEAKSKLLMNLPRDDEEHPELMRAFNQRGVAIDHTMTGVNPTVFNRRLDFSGEGYFRGGAGMIPDKSVLQQISKESYNQSPPKTIGSYSLLSSTPTLKFYGDGNTIVVGIRGTNDARDIKADAMIAIGQLEKSDRFRADMEALKQFQNQYPPSTYSYYGVGHSLGGAILDSFLDMGLIQSGVSYNPAVQPQHLRDTNLNNTRVFAENDPLYALAKPFLAKTPEVRKPQSQSVLGRLIRSIPYAGKAYDLYQGHSLDQFQGGFLGIDAKDVFNPFVSNAQIKQKAKAYQDAKPKSPPTDWKKLAGVAGTLLSKLSGGANPHSKFGEQLKKVGFEPSLYLKEAQQRAKNAGLPYKVLGFASDGIHKLAIPNADGRMIKFGRVGYGDHLMYSYLEKVGSVPKGTADAKKSTFHRSHEKIKGNWRNDPFSPNNLALKVLW